MSAWPIGWHSAQLGDIAKTTSGGTPSRRNPEYYDGDILWFKSGELNDGFVSSSEETITRSGLENSNCRLFPSGTLLMAMYGATVGKLAILNTEATTNQAVCAISPSAKLDRDFLFWFLRFKRHELIHNSFGAAQPNISQTVIREIEIPIPHLDEQRRIVARIEELTRRAEEARKLAAEREAEQDILLQALYSRMIEEADWTPLKEVASLVRRAVKTKPDGCYEEMGIRSFGKGTFQKPILTGKQIGNKRIYTIHEGDLVFNNVFAWEKAIAVAKAEDHGRVGSHRFITYAPHEGQATSEFLCHHFLSERGIEDIRAASPGSAGRNRTLGLNKLEKILVPVPDYDEQKRFAKIAKSRQAIQLENASIEEDLKAFHAALLAKAFRGEL